MRNLIDIVESADAKSWPPGTLFHGTPSRDAAEAIIDEGLVPGRGEQTGAYKPVAGRSYLAQRLGPALHAAIGEGDVRFGTAYLLVFDGTDLGNVHPDEDCLAEFIRDRLRRVDGPGDIQFPEHLMGGFEITTDDPVERTVVEFIARAMTAGQVDGIVRRDMREMSAVGGKRALKKMPEAMRRWFLTRPGVNFAVTGNPRPNEMWSLARADAFREVMSTFNEMAVQPGSETWARHRIIHAALERAFQQYGRKAWSRDA